MQQSGSDDPKGRLKNERRKIAGTAHDSKNNKMGGQGRFYSPKCGVIGSSGGATPGWREYNFVVDVNVGDTVTYRIDGSGFEGGFFSFMAWEERLGLRRCWGFYWG